MEIRWQRSTNEEQIVTCCDNVVADPSAGVSQWPNDRKMQRKCVGCPQRRVQGEKIGKCNGSLLAAPALGSASDSKIGKCNGNVLVDPSVGSCNDEENETCIENVLADASAVGSAMCDEIGNAM